MNILDKYRLELSNSVNNLAIDKLIKQKNHMMSKDEFEKIFISNMSEETDNIGFDFESLENYEKWLGENIERD